MKHAPLIFILILIQSLQMTAQDMTDYTWKNRIVILYENENTLEEVSTTLDIIQNNTIAFKERDILVFIQRNGVFLDTDKKQVQFKIPKELPNSFNGYLLIGKDGGVKDDNPYPFNLEKLVQLIDSMPMRRSEMRSNQ